MFLSASRAYFCKRDLTLLCRDAWPPCSPRTGAGWPIAQMSRNSWKSMSFRFPAQVENGESQRLEEPTPFGREMGGNCSSRISDRTG